MSQLAINIDEITVPRQPVERSLSREWLDGVLGGDHATDYHARDAGLLVGEATRIEREVYLDASFTAPLVAPCRRCLTDVEVDVPVRFALHFRPAARGSDLERAVEEEERSASFDPAGADEEQFEGKRIDLVPVLREQLLLSLPAAPLCKETCKGLCAVCGQDKNTVDCGHEDHPPDPRWSALKNLKV